MNPFYRNPDHPNFNRRAYHHDYSRRAKYLITIVKNTDIPPFSVISGDVKSKDNENICVILQNRFSGFPDAIKEWLSRFPMITLVDYVVMPDHLHLCLDVVDKLPNKLSLAVAGLMGRLSRAYHMSLPADERPERIQPIFSKGFNDKIAYSESQWKTQIKYVRDNPRRYLLKKAFPNFLRRRWLLTMDKEQFVLIGNIFLLNQPHVFSVKFSRRFSEEEAAQVREQWCINIRNGGIPISPFIHPKEREMRDMAIDEGSGYIRVCTNGFAERGAASGKEFELLSQGRLLLVGQTVFSTRKEDLRYSYAQILNGIARRMAEYNQGGHRFLIRPI